MKRNIFSKDFYKLLEEKRRIIYANPNSIMREFDERLLNLGLYHGFDEETFLQSVKGKTELIGDLLKFFEKAKETNEKEFFAEVLFAIGYEKLTWNMGDLLYRINKKEFIDDYCQIAKDNFHGEARQMIISLIGKIKGEKALQTLIFLVEDESVVEHVVLALTNFKNKKVYDIMKEFATYEQKWVSSKAVKYIQKYEEKTVKTGDGSVPFKD